MVMHSTYGGQGQRSTAGLVRRGPGLLLISKVAVLSLSGLYFLSGSVSKDAILWSMLRSSASMLGLVVLMTRVCLRVGYGFRLVLSMGSCSRSRARSRTSSGFPHTAKASFIRLVALAVAQGSCLGGQTLLRFS